MPDSTYPLQLVPGGQVPRPYPGEGYGTFPTGASEEEGAFDFYRWIAIVIHRKWLLLFSVILSLIVGLTLTLRETPVYSATATVSATPPTGNVYGFRDFATPMAAARNFAGDQVQILRSAALAQRVAKDARIDMISNVSAGEVKVGWFAELKDDFDAWVANLEGKAPETEELEDVPVEDDTQAENQAAIENRVRGGLMVVPITDTSIISLSINDTDPKRAAALVNAVAKAYVAMNAERQFNESNKSHSFYDGQMRKTRANLEDLERRLVEYARGKDLVNIENLLEHNENEFRMLSAQLLGAEERYYKAESKLASLRASGGADGGDVLNSKVVQDMKTRRAELDDEYQQKLEVFLPEYPKMVQMRRQIETIDRQIREETGAVTRSVEVDYQAAKREKESLEKRVARARNELLSLRDRSADFKALVREKQALESLYSGLIDRVKQGGVAAEGGYSNNISILDLAAVPGGPISPNLNANLTKAAGAGLVIGLLLIVLLEKLDDTVKSAEEAERLTGLPILGSLPYVVQRHFRGGEVQSERRLLQDPMSAVGEAGRSLRTTLLFASAGGAPKVMHFTSSAPAEGKTTAVYCTALSFARSGATVLVIDGDLRNPSLHRLVDASNSLGLSNYLVSDVQPADVVQSTDVEGLFVVTSGPLPPNPVELLASERLSEFLRLAAERFDFVCFDGPPVLGLADALVLAGVAGATLFVVEPGQSRRGAVKDSIKRLRASQARLIGVVLQKVGQRGGSYGYGYGYKYDYQYMYTYGKKTNEMAPI